MIETSSMTTIRGNTIDVSIIDRQPGRGADNANQYTIVIKAHSQPMRLGNKETSSISFTLVGDIEYSEFLDAIVELAK